MSTSESQQANTPDACVGPVCANCCRCDGECGRNHVGTRHLDVCACPPPAEHHFCVDCERVFDPAATCPKCGGENVTVAFRPADKGCGGFRGCFSHPPIPEYIQRTCVRCAYGWKERPINA